ncbi:MAG: helix-turn-helix domain-containing protein [Chloroflexi bacterium]|nr:helix-turn-helix domain-containing protein [Chloroflexota bacterium]
MTPKIAPGLDQWLTLEQTCRRLGVHASTLRRWVDQGDISSLRTPGGHRRFALADLERFEREHRQPPPALQSGLLLADHALVRTRESIAQQRWLVTFDEEERRAGRELGRRLVGLMLQHIAAREEEAELLLEARAIGEQHARNGLARGHSLADLLQAIAFFRRAMLETALGHMHRRSASRDEPGLLLLRRIDGLLNEVQSGVVAYWTGAGQGPPLERGTSSDLY